MQIIQPKTSNSSSWKRIEIQFHANEPKINFIAGLEIANLVCHQHSAFEKVRCKSNFLLVISGCPHFRFIVFHTNLSIIVNTKLCHNLVTLTSVTLPPFVGRHTAFVTSPSPTWSAILTANPSNTARKTFSAWRKDACTSYFYDSSYSGNVARSCGMS